MNMNDKVCIEGLEAEAVIGVYAFEQVSPQPLLIDFELTTDFSQAFESDDLKDALDYDALSKKVRSFCKESHFALLEALAGGIIYLLFEHPSIRKVGVRIRKPQALKGAMASVWCERTREAL